MGTQRGISKQMSKEGLDMMLSSKGTLRLRLLVVLFMMTIVVSCDQNTRFNRARWDWRPDPAFAPPLRKGMLQDMTTNHKLKGLSIKELVALLGSPNYVHRNSVGYRISEEYGAGIDPVCTEVLSFTLSGDSVVMDYQVQKVSK